MPRRIPCWSLFTLCAFLLPIGWSAAASAQTISGQARAAHVTRLDPLGTPTTTALADTGTLGDAGDARRASQATAEIPSVLKCGTVHAVTIGWADQVSSEASLANLSLSVAGHSIGEDFIMSRATAIQGGAGTGAVSIDGLSLNGLPVAVTGAVNQTIQIPGGRLVINERQESAAGTTTNALHLIVDGIADVVVASAAARVQ